MAAPEYAPGREEFLRLAKEHTLVPVWREVLGDLETPVGAYRKLGNEPNSFLLESVEHGERWGRYSFIGVDPFLTMTSREGKVGWEGSLPALTVDGSSPPEALREVLSRLRSPAIPGLPPFHGGAVGYLGYDLVRYLERLPHTTDDDTHVPELLLMFCRTVLVFDHLEQQATVVTNV